MAETQESYAKAMAEAGIPDNIKQYILSRDIKSIEVMASVACKVEEVDEILVKPLESGFTLPGGDKIQLSPLELPVVKAKLRFLWRKCCKESTLGEVQTGAPPPTVAWAASTTKSASKELPSGFSQQQIAKFEAVKIGAEARKFPQGKLIGEESVIAPVVHEMRAETHTAIGLHEVVQARYFEAFGNPKPLSAVKKKNKSQAAILTINSDYQIETEAETPWQPCSVLSFLDCLDSLRVLMIFVEMGSEPAVSKYVDWFEKQVLSRPGKLEQLRCYWASTSWRIALALRAKRAFNSIAEEIIFDNQALQDAVSREVVLPNRGGRQRQLRYGQDFDRNGKGKGKTKTKTKVARVSGTIAVGRDAVTVGDRAHMATRLRRGPHGRVHHRGHRGSRRPRSSARKTRLLTRTGRRSRDSAGRPTWLLRRTNPTLVPSPPQ